MHKFLGVSVLYLDLIFITNMDFVKGYYKKLINIYAACGKESQLLNCTHE